MTKNERIAKLEAEVEELKKRPTPPFLPLPMPYPVYPVYQPVNRCWNCGGSLTYGHYCNRLVGGWSVATNTTGSLTSVAALPSHVGHHS